MARFDHARPLVVLSVDCDTTLVADTHATKWAPGLPDYGHTGRLHTRDGDGRKDGGPFWYGDGLPINGKLNCLGKNSTQWISSEYEANREGS